MRRRRRRRRLLLGLGLVATVVAAALTAGLLGFGADPRATAVAVRDGVRIGVPKQAARSLKGTAQVGTGAWLETGPLAAASLDFGDGSRVVLDGSSRLRLESLTWRPDGSLDITVRLERGQAWTVVPVGPTFFRFLGAARASFVAGAAATYSVSVVGSDTVFDLFRGTLVVHNGPGSGVWQLQEGYSTTSAADQTRPPGPIPDAVLRDPFLSSRLWGLAIPSSNLNRR